MGSLHKPTTRSIRGTSSSCGLPGTIDNTRIVIPTIWEVHKASNPVEKGNQSENGFSPKKCSNIVNPKFDSLLQGVID